MTDTANAFKTIERVETLSQTAVRLSAALLTHWLDAPPSPIEIHLNGVPQIGKSHLVNRTCMMLFDRYIGSDDFNGEVSTLTGNDITAVSIDEGHRRFNWPDGYIRRFTYLVNKPAGKTALFVEHPCDARLLYEKRKIVQWPTKPNIKIEIALPRDEICSRLIALIPTERDAILAAAKSALTETSYGETGINRRFSEAVYGVCRNFVRASDVNETSVDQILDLRSVKTDFDLGFKTSTQIITAYEINNASAEDAERGLGPLAKRYQEGMLARFLFGE